MRFSIVGHDRQHLDAVALDQPRASRSASKRRRQHDRASRAPSRSSIWPSPCAWNSGAGSRHDRARVDRHDAQEPGERLEARRARDRAPFGAPVVPGGEDHDPALLGRGVERRGVSGAQLREGREAGVRRARPREDPHDRPDAASVTTSVNSSSWTSTCGCSRSSTAPSSGSGQRRVQQQRVGAELRRRRPSTRRSRRRCGTGSRCRSPGPSPSPRARARARSCARRASA